MSSKYVILFTLNARNVAILPAEHFKLGFTLQAHTYVFILQYLFYTYLFYSRQRKKKKKELVSVVWLLE